MNSRVLAFAASLACAFAVAAPLDAASEKILKPTTKTKTKDDAAAGKLAARKGIKHAIGVLDFENEAGWASQWTIGENLRMMLESSLFATERFVIVERGELGAVLAEQDLQKSNRSAKADGVAQTGKVRSARYLASGSVTEVSESTSGDTGGINVKGFRIGGSSQKAQMTLVVKLIDTTTGEVVASERVRGVAGKSGVNLGYSGSQFGGNLASFAKTPAGEAAQDCVNQAVKFIAEKMQDFPVEGSVVTVSGEQVIVSLGENFGVQAGQKLIVRTDGEVLTDPATGAVLDRLEGEVTATLQVERVREKISYCSLVEGEMPERGATVIVQ